PGDILRQPRGRRDATQIDGGDDLMGAPGPGRCGRDLVDQQDLGPGDAQRPALRIDLDARFVDGGDETEGIGSRMSVAGIERIPYDHSSAGLEIVHFSPSSVERVLSQPKTPWTAAVTGVAGEGGCIADHGHR